MRVQERPWPGIHTSAGRIQVEEATVPVREGWTGLEIDLQFTGCHRLDRSSVLGLCFPEK